MRPAAVGSPAARLRLFPMAVLQRTPQYGGMGSRHCTLLSAVVSSALVVMLAGCSAPVTSGDVPPAPAESSAPEPSNSGDAGPSTGDPVPVLHFVAHGEGAPNTVGPNCSWGIEKGSGSPFRVTAPASWQLRGSVGGSGPSAIRYELGDADVVVDLVEAREDLQSAAFETLDFGSQAGTADLAGTQVPIVEVSLRGGEATGYGITDVPWLENITEMMGGARHLTVLVTSAEAGVPTLQDATSLLSSVRVERCAGIGQAIVFASQDRVTAVPEIVNDPLGKTRPSAPQPSLNPALGVRVWSVEQLAYLLPLPEPTDRCVAEVLHDESTEDQLPQLLRVLLMTPIGVTNLTEDDAATLSALGNC